MTGWKAAVCRLGLEAADAPVSYPHLRLAPTTRKPQAEPRDVKREGVAVPDEGENAKLVGVKTSVGYGAKCNSTAKVHNRQAKDMGDTSVLKRE
jgi:hypothetical protein